MKSTPKLTKAERKQRIRAIAREFEAKKRALGLQKPILQRGPIFYLVIILILFAVGASFLQAFNRGGGRMLPNARILHAQQSVDALMEALGRFKFHCGTCPTAVDGGLYALASKTVRYKGWVGPYASRIVNDPWRRPYVYEPEGTNGFPTVLSLGADGVRGTADDITPDTELFLKPFRDTTWTNDWVPYTQRGIIVVPHREKKKEK